MVRYSDDTVFTVHDITCFFTVFHSDSGIGIALLDSDRDTITSCIVDIRTGLISSVFTNEFYRRQGFCEFLLRLAIRDFGGRNLFVREDNTPALNLYTKLGFEIVDDVYLVDHKSYIMEITKEVQS